MLTDSILPEDFRPAYPIVIKVGGTTEWRCGISRRELFAAMVMQGNASNPTCDEMAPQDSAKFAVAWADALIAELDK